MVTVAQALQQISGARFRLGESQRQIRARERELQSAAQQIGAAELQFESILPRGGTLSAQFEARQQFGAASTGIAQLRRTRSIGLGEVSAARTQLGRAEAQLATAREQAREAERQIGARESLLKDIGRAEKLAVSGRFPSEFESERFIGLFEQFREGFKAREEAERQIEEAAAAGIITVAPSGAIELTELGKQTSSLFGETPAATVPGVTITPTGGVSTAFPERFTETVPTAPSLAPATRETQISPFFREIIQEAQVQPFSTGQVLGFGRQASGQDILFSTGAAISRRGADVLRQPSTARFFGGEFQPDLLGGRLNLFPQELRTTAAGFGARVGAELLPRTKEEVAIQTGFAALGLGAVSVLPAVATKTALGAFGGFQLGTIAAPGQTIEQRVARGLEAGLSLGGAAFLPTRAQLAFRQQRAQVGALQQQGIISPQAAESLRAGINLQKFFRRQPDVPVPKTAISAIPAELTALEQEAFAKVLLVEDPRIFGSQAVRLRGLQPPGGDIDVAAIQNIRIIEEFGTQLRQVSTQPVVQRGEAIGIGGEKAFDIKTIGRLKEFPLTLRPAKTLEGVKISRLAEQFSRAISGTLQLRKGGKDIGSAILSARGIIGQSADIARATTLPGLKQFRQFRVALAERRLAKFELAVPEFTTLVERTGQAEIVALPPQFVPTTPFPQFPQIKGKRGQFGAFVDTSQIRQPRIGRVSQRQFDEFIAAPRDFVARVPRVRGGISSQIRPPKVTPSRFFPSTFGLPRIAPSRISSIEGLTPSGFVPTTTDPRIGITTTTPPPTSRFPPPPPPTGIPQFDVTFPVPSGFGFEPPRARAIPKRQKDRRISVPRRRREREFPIFESRIAPSFTAIVFDIRGQLPKGFKVGSRDIGVLPGQIRKIPKKRKKK